VYRPGVLHDNNSEKEEYHRALKGS
jgi:hypothetical protein